MKIATILLCFPLVFSLGGCQSQQEETPKTDAPPPANQTVSTEPVPSPGAQRQTISLLRDAIEPVLVENPAQAFAHWRQYKASRPMLILLSDDPFLQPLPEQKTEQTLISLASASTEDLISRSTARITNPLLLPTMATSAALMSQIFSSLVWELPTDSSVTQLSTKAFQEQLVGFGAISEEEASSIDYEKGIFTGKIRNTPFQARHPQATSPVTGPVIVHIDLSYFSPLYKGEIKTPLYPLIYKTLEKLRQQEVQALAVTISYSNRGGNLPLATRFIAPDLATIFQQPELLDQELPQLWQQRSNSLYLPNFFQSSKAKELLQSMDISAPDRPGIKYALYQVHRELKQGDVALDYLAQAVALDKSYATEYLSLASVARDKSLPDQALKMLQTAAKSFPDDPFIKLQLISFLLEQTHKEPARKLLAQLQQLDWSETFYPAWPAKLDELGREIIK